LRPGFTPAAARAQLTQLCAEKRRTQKITQTQSLVDDKTTLELASKQIP